MECPEILQKSFFASIFSWIICSERSDSSSSSTSFFHLYGIAPNMSDVRTSESVPDCSMRTGNIIVFRYKSSFAFLRHMTPGIISGGGRSGHVRTESSPNAKKHGECRGSTRGGKYCKTRDPKSARTWPGHGAALGFAAFCLGQSMDRERRCHGIG